MRDLPVFDTVYGIASLTMKEIPYRQEAYVRVLEVFSGQWEGLIKVCTGFCRACGAERVYASGIEELEKFPLHTAVYEMRGEARIEPEKVENLFPVTKETVSRWREIYNDRMRGVDNAATLEGRDEKKILSSGGAYFIHRAGELLGIGWLDGDMILCVASVKPGMGERVMHTLLSTVEDAAVRLEVASTNEKAIGLYERLGFVKIREIVRWYRVG